MRSSTPHSAPRSPASGSRRPAAIGARRPGAAGLVALAALLWALPGCAAARAGYFIVSAQQKYEAALSEGAAERAPYETTLAGAYLDKAREEDGYNDFGITEKLCKRSMEMSARALTRSEDLSPVQNPETFIPEERKKDPEKPKEPEPVIDIDLDAN